MYQLQYYYNFNSWNQFQNSSETIHVLWICIITQNHTWVIQNTNKQRRQCRVPRNQQLCELVPMISSGICADYNNQSAVPLTAFNPVQWIHYSNINLSFLDQVTHRILTDHTITRQGEANRSLRKTCVRVPLALHKQPTLLNHKILVITIEYQIFSLLKKRVSKG